MKIGIDARFYGLKHAGLGRYVKNLIIELEKIDSENEFVVFLQKDNFEEYRPSKKNFYKVIINTHPYSIKSQLVDWFKIRKLKLDLIHFTHFSYPIFCPSKFIVTIHDLIKTDFDKKGSQQLSGLRHLIRNWGYRVLMRKAVLKSERIITATDFTRKELLKKYKIDKNKIIVTSYGFETAFGENKVFSKEKNNLFRKYKIAKPYLLYVGNAYPYKNVGRLLSVFYEVKDLKKFENLKLYLVCSRSVFYNQLVQRIKELKIENSVKMLGFVSDECLQILYANSLAYITASLGEGFGLTGLEAMICGAPVLSSNRSCLPEVYGDAALFFDPESNVSVIEKIEMVFDGKFRSGLIKKGYDQVKKYSWSKMAKEVLKIYSNLVGDIYENRN